MIYQVIASRFDSDAKPPGQRIDVGGYRLHLYCQGRGNPAIVVDILESFVDGGQLRKLAEPTTLPNGKRLSDLRLDHPRHHHDSSVRTLAIETWR